MFVLGLAWSADSFGKKTMILAFFVGDRSLAGSNVSIGFGVGLFGLRRLNFNGEFDASRAVRLFREYMSGERVSNT